MKCCFIGHRDCLGIENEIYNGIKELIHFGVTEFYSGGMGNFDKICEAAVKKSGGKLIFVPYSIKMIKEKEKIWYDDIICLFGNKPYSKYDIPKRNRWLVEQSDICFCYVYKDGGAKKTYDYACKLNRQIINMVK